MSPPLFLALAVSLPSILNVPDEDPRATKCRDGWREKLLLSAYFDDYNERGREGQTLARSNEVGFSLLADILRLDLVTSDYFKAFSSNEELILKMKSNTDRTISRAQKPICIRGEGLNWVFIAGGALLSTLSVRLGFKLKQALETKRPDNAANGKFTARRRSRASTTCCFTQDEDGCYHCISGISEGTVEIKQPPTSPLSKEAALALPLVTITAPGSIKENGVIWGSSPERLDLPRKPFHQYSNSSDSPCISESGSDILSKREVINKLRQQLKRRDEMILEMQAQITDLKNSSDAQLMHSTHLQSQLDSVNQDLFESEREIQRLRKAISDHCMGETGSPKKFVMGRNGRVDPRNGQANGFLDGSRDLESHYAGTVGVDGKRIEMLKREVEELKEAVEAKEFLLRSYKEQNMELCSKMKELQLRLVSQVPSIL
ncbi:uncharacterized protein LOC131249450 [Magnolia sinica]|uniref:uncharacterized protein LOC131249450 n=1 Tax=Magnolia sinica TaxID=86752 RepID=UPI00265B39A9|nr:uncharacterized protein LOC131249450 [Magnolia sinica]